MAFNEEQRRHDDGRWRATLLSSPELTLDRWSPEARFRPSFDAQWTPPGDPLLKTSERADGRVSISGWGFDQGVQSAVRQGAGARWDPDGKTWHVDRGYLVTVEQIIADHRPGARRFAVVESTVDTDDTEQWATPVLANVLGPGSLLRAYDDGSIWAITELGRGGQVVCRLATPDQVLEARHRIESGQSRAHIDPELDLDDAEGEVGEVLDALAWQEAALRERLAA
ncbi:hypothetical protein [Leifsonia sp. Leaf264]|uniref:hypothetical protein n=1 Tax=Leifsonia sp. Leaf264 TaxID=1736314 RepID=UPI0006F336FF|nr:hypothetical protein [Leifsonia sp. Leaf264]KQP01449.1 hypothetical protein ASF30_02190 [Leifsonia sp. Leaf264]